MHWDYNIKFFKYFIENKRAFVQYAILSIVVGLLELFGVALTYPFINELLSHDSFKLSSLLIGLTIVSAFFIKNIFMIFYNKLQADFTKECEFNINKKFMYYFLYGNYQTVSKIPYAKKTLILGFLPSCAINNYLFRILNLNVNVFVFIILITFLFVKFFVATFVALIFSLILLFSEALFFKHKTATYTKKINKATEELNKTVNDPLVNIKNVKILKGEQYFLENYTQKLLNHNNLTRDFSFYNSIPPYITEPFIIIILAVLLAIISMQNITDTKSLIASYALIVSAIFRLAPTISRIQVNLTGINVSYPQIKDLVDYYEDFGLNNFKPAQNTYEQFNNLIEMRNVEFSYKDKIVLQNINLKIKKGEFIGFAGSSGVGKTTLIDIIAGLLKVEKGEIYLDGKLVENNCMPSLKIGYIPQEYTTVSASIRENVAFGSNEIDDNKIIKALKQAQLYDFIIENYPEGIYAKPFVDSTGFSQGQKQRLAIARALYTDPDIIILDEATSSLDLKTEDEICEVLNKLKGEKTIIAIAHRLSTIKNADKVYLMQNSTIIDSGSFEELHLRNDEFKKLVELNNANLIH